MQNNIKGMQMLADYHDTPFDLNGTKITFKEIYDKWSKSQFLTISGSNVNGYKASYKLCSELESKIFRDLKLADLQHIVDTCGKNYPTLRKLKVLFNQLYDYSMKNDLCNKDYSEYVDILKFKDKNPDKLDRERFTKFDVERLWKLSDDKHYQIVLMLIYTGVRVSELLDLKKSKRKIGRTVF